MIQSSTLKFLKDLRKNNNKPWFDDHRDQYEAAKENILSLAGALIKGIAAFDPPLGNLHPKDCTFRINRDIRFSKDKSPYKSNMACYFNKAGKKGNGGGYYIHIEPGKSFAAGGIWMPGVTELASIRQEIDYDLNEWKKIISNTSFKKQFPRGFADNEILTRPPKGYDENNPAIGFIKMKSFVIMRSFSDTEVQSKSFVKDVAKAFQLMHPLVSFLNKAID
jgi:uncharacterized protein (TIGR02453 family)